MEYSLKNLGFCSFVPVEGFEQGALRKELIIVPSIKHFKAKRVLESLLRCRSSGLQIY